MEPNFSIPILLTGIAIFLARIVDVSLGTLRTISIIQGRTWVSFWLGFVEIIIWLWVISTVIPQVRAIPILAAFYAFGFACGNMVGIRIERWLALGHIIIRVISREYFKEMADALRKAGFGVTAFQGEGIRGPVMELCIDCRRKNLREIVQLVHAIEPETFYITEQVGEVSKIYRPIMTPVTGWRAILKKNNTTGLWQSMQPEHRNLNKSSDLSAGGRNMKSIFEPKNLFHCGNHQHSL